jgi:ubiquinone biosynthesis protein
MPTTHQHSTSRRARRRREIATTFSRHGLGYLVDHVHQRDASPTPPEHVRLALEELGPTFVKLGQVLSTRSDLLPPEYLQELVKLQDAAPPLPPGLAGSVIEEELGRTLSEVFASFDDAPLAAASIGEAHAATLLDGADVVVKVRRPQVVEQIEDDLELLQDLAARAERHWETAAEYDVVGLVGEFAQTLRAELDYLAEGRTAERFAGNFAGDDDVRIPHVYWDTTTSRVLTLQRLRGIKISDLPALDASGIDRPELAKRATRLTAQMIFEDGVFHADPHPGNFFVENDGRIGVVDFGMVGTIDDRLRSQLGAVLIAFTRRDDDGLTDAILALGVARQRVDRIALRADIAGLLDRYEGVGLGEVAIARMLDEAVAIMRRHRLHLPRDLALLVKVLIVDEGLAATLDPNYRLDEELAPYAKRLIARDRAPETLLRELIESGADAAQLGAGLPRRLERLLRAAEAGDAQVRVTSDDVLALGAHIKRAGNTIAIALLAAAAIEAGATLFSAGRRRGRRWRVGTALSTNPARARPESRYRRHRA